MSKSNSLMIATVVASAALLGACVAPQGDDGGQRFARANREETTGSMLRRPSNSPQTTIGKDQIDPNQILNQGATQPRVQGG